MVYLIGIVNMIIHHYVEHPDAPGGLSAYVRQITAEQGRLGHSVRVWSKAAILDGNAAGGVSSTPFQSADVVHLHEWLAPSALGRAERVRTVHGHQPYCPSGSAYLAARRQPCDRDFAFVSCALGKVVDRCGSVRPRRVVADFGRVLNERRDTRGYPVIAISEFMRARMVRNGFDSSDLRVLAPPMATPVDRPAALGDAFLFAGRLTRAKGTRSLIEACSLVEDVGVDIVGDGPDREWMTTRARELGLSHRVRFHGWLAPAEVRTLMAAAFAILIPSVWHEPAGMVLLEALAVGRPVITARTGGLTEIAEASGAGLLVEPDRADILAHAMRALLVDRAAAEAMGITGWRYAQAQPGVGAHCLALEDIYVSAASGDAT